MTHDDAGPDDPSATTRQLVELAIRKFVLFVYGDRAIPRRAENALRRIPAVTFDELLRYVRGQVDLNVLLRIVSLPEPRFAGLYFPMLNYDETCRWQAYMPQIIECLVRMKLDQASFPIDTSKPAKHRQVKAGQRGRGRRDGVVPIADAPPELTAAATQAQASAVTTRAMAGGEIALPL